MARSPVGPASARWGGCPGAILGGPGYHARRALPSAGEGPLPATAATARTDHEDEG